MNDTRIRSRVKNPCVRCGRGDLVWFKTRRGDWTPCDPMSDDPLAPDPYRIHRMVCTGEKSNRPTRSYKPSEYRLQTKRR